MNLSFGAVALTSKPQNRLFVYGVAGRFRLGESFLGFELCCGERRRSCNYTKELMIMILIMKAFLGYSRDKIVT